MNDVRFGLPFLAFFLRNFSEQIEIFLIYDILWIYVNDSSVLAKWGNSQENRI